MRCRALLASFASVVEPLFALRLPKKMAQRVLMRICLVFLSLSVVSIKASYIKDASGRVRFPADEDVYKGSFNNGGSAERYDSGQFCGGEVPRCTPNSGSYRAKSLFGEKYYKCIKCPAGWGWPQSFFWSYVGGPEPQQCPNIPCWFSDEYKHTCLDTAQGIAAKWEPHGPDKHVMGCCSLASCVPCGYYEASVPAGDSAGDGCRMCELGHEPEYGYDGFVKKKCVQCPRGFVRGKDDARCVACAAGHEPNPDQSACVQCELPQVSTDGVECGNCYANEVPTVTNGLGVGCTTCAANQQANAERTACEACPANFESASGQTCGECILANVGGRLTITLRAPSQASCTVCDPRSGVYRQQTGVAKKDIVCAPLPRRKLEISDTDIIVTGHDEFINQNVYQNGDQNSVLADSLLIPGPGKWVDSNGLLRTCGCSRASFRYSVLCGSDLDHSSGVMLVGSDGANITLEELQNTGLELSAITTQYSLQPAGECRPCSKCLDGEYNHNCNSGLLGGLFSPGQCKVCKQSCSEPNQFLKAPDEFLQFVQDLDEVYSSQDACSWQFFDADNVESSYVPRSDLACEQCKTVYLKRDGDVVSEWYIVAGCGNTASFSRWHHEAEILAENGILEVVACDFSNKAECSILDSTEKFQQADAYTEVADLLPYCPPGWRVDVTAEGCPLSQNDAEYSTFAPACCVRCQTCNYENEQRDTADWQACSGSSAVDTQTCTGACGIGEYMVESVDPADSSKKILSCARCTTCYDGEHAVTPLAQRL